MFEGPCLNGRFGKTDCETVYRNCQALCTMGRKTWRHGVPHEQNCAVCGDNFCQNKYDLSFLCPGQLEYSSIDKMAKYDWSTFRNYVAFLAGELAPGTRHPHHDCESSSCYHDAFLPWSHYHNNIVLFYHDSPITRSHFMDPTDHAIKGFYCTWPHDQQTKHFLTLLLNCSSYRELNLILGLSTFSLNMAAKSSYVPLGPDNVGCNWQ